MQSPFTGTGEGNLSLTELIELARQLPPMTDEERWWQRGSFAFGNVAIHNPSIARVVVDAAGCVSSSSRCVRKL